MKRFYSVIRKIIGELAAVSFFVDHRVSRVILNNGIEEASIVLGFSGKKHELVDVELAKRDGIQLIRRFTGGGTVIVDKDTCFSTFIMNVMSNYFDFSSLW